MINRLSLIFSLLLAFTAANPVGLTAQTNEEYGVATYYGDEFHGRKTASGEKYNKNELTCAHKTLPFGSKVKVTRLDNKKSVVVRVNDRGPFIKGYIVDLSRKAAAEIGMLDDGVVKVKLEVIEKKTSKKDEEVAAAPKPETRNADGKTGEKNKPGKADVPDKEAPKADKKDAKNEDAKTFYEPKLVTGKDYKTYDLYQIELKRPGKKGFGIQVATLNNYENVFGEVAKLQGIWGNKVLVNIEQPKTEDDKPLYKLLIGPFPDKKTADKNLKIAAKKGYKKCFVINLADGERA